MAKTTFTRPPLPGGATATAAAPKAAPATPAPVARPQAAPTAPPTRPGPPRPAQAPVARPAAPQAAQQPPPRPAGPARPQAPAATPTPAAPAPRPRRAPVAAAPVPQVAEEVELPLTSDPTETENLEVLPPLEEGGEETARELVTYEPEDTNDRPLAIPFAAPGRIEGEFDSSDLQVAYIQLVQGVSTDLLELGFQPGDFVLNREAVLTDLTTSKEAPFTFVVLSCKKVYREKTAIGEPMGRVFDKRHDAEAAGLTIDWDGETPPAIESNLICSIAIQAPDFLQEHPLFKYEHAGQRYALAGWRITGTSYRIAAKPLINAIANQLRGNPMAGMFQLGVRVEKGRVNSYMVPVVKFAGMLDPELGAYLAQAASGAAEPADD